MMVGLVLLLVGIALVVVNPILGLIPGVILAVIGLVILALSTVAKGAGAVLRIGSTKTCPDCRSKIPNAANVCMHCGYRFS